MFEELETSMHEKISAKFIGEDGLFKFYIDKNKNFYSIKKPNEKIIGKYKAEKIPENIVNFIKKS